MDFVSGHEFGSSSARLVWPGLALDHSYARLPGTMHGTADIEPLNKPELLWFNTPLAQSLGLNQPPDDVSAAFASGRLTPYGASLVRGRTAERPWGALEPVSRSEHEVRLGEHIDPCFRRRDLSLLQHEKGGGAKKVYLSVRTALHQLLMGEALNAVGIRAPRTLAIAHEGANGPLDEARASVIRVDQSPLTIGAFEFAYRYLGFAELRHLADYAIARIDPALMVGGTPYTGLFDQVCDQVSATTAQWAGLGFVHSKLDTQLMPIEGSTSIAPHSGFIAEYDIDWISHPLDATGRYAFSAQPIAAHWNLCRFANALKPLIDSEQQDADESTRTTLDGFFNRHEHYRLTYFRHKLGLFVTRAGDERLINQLLQIMYWDRANPTFVFRQICQLPAVAEARSWLINHFQQREKLNHWVDRYLERLALEPLSGKPKHLDYMASVNPARVPRPQAVSMTLEKAASGDLSAIDQFLATHGLQ